MILDDLVTATRNRLAARQALIAPAELAMRAETMVSRPVAPLSEALSEHFGLIAEVKQASPSKGVIAEEFPVDAIARDYATAEVDAISVLTEQDYFHGSLDILERVSALVPQPVLRKDFIIDPYMIDEAKVAGAHIVLLIVAILSDQQLHDFYEYALSLDLEVLVECHNEAEIKRANALHPTLIGINNRDLTTFEVDLQNSVRLRPQVNDSSFVIAESGVREGRDLTMLQEGGLSGALIGETLMRADNRPQMIRSLREAVL